MKRLTLILSLLIAVVISGKAQTPANIFIIDVQSGAQVPAIGDAAMAFRNSLIALVTNTYTARVQQAVRIAPGSKSFLIQQLDPKSNGNAYQLMFEKTWLGRANVIYTFLYNVDQNKLFFSNPSTGTWVEEIIQPANIKNLNDCQTFGIFNEQQAPAIAAMPDNGANGPAPQDAPADTATITANTAPPAIPDYDLPACPQDGDLWQPGYWAYSVPNANYYWVPGEWLAPPTAGYLWTPPYWALVNGAYAFNAGYWGEHIGFYGGIDYGFGYGGAGFVGGEWRNGYFAYNTAVLNVGFNTHVYVDARYDGRIRNHFTYNGRGGSVARASEREMGYRHERHVMATAEQRRHAEIARADKGQYRGPDGKVPARLGDGINHRGISRDGRGVVGPIKTGTQGPVKAGIAGPVKPGPTGPVKTGSTGPVKPPINGAKANNSKGGILGGLGKGTTGGKSNVLTAARKH